METRYWVGVVGAMHAKIGRDRGFCAFSHGQKSAVARLSPGDRFAYYAPREGYKEGAVVQGFVAVGTVQDGDPYEVDFNGSPGWVRPAKTDLFGVAPAKPLLESLSFVSNPKYWGMAFRRSLFDISPEDFAVINTALQKGKNND